MFSLIDKERYRNTLKLNNYLYNTYYMDKQKHYLKVLLTCKYSVKLRVIDKFVVAINPIVTAQSM
jgi:hypothetical protein